MDDSQSDTMSAALLESVRIQIEQADSPHTSPHGAGQRAILNSPTHEELVAQVIQGQVDVGTA